MKFIHTADWQIGARFRQFGPKAASLRAARLRTLGRALEHADNARADGFLIAGDLFEDNQVEHAVVTDVFERLAAFPQLPIFILPGNHDPFTGPRCIWSRRPFSAPPAHVTIFTAPAAVPIGDGWLLANPLTQKRSLVDPSLRLVELTTKAPTDVIRIGITHGSPAIGAKHQSDDFPIDLTAASRAGLDYLAIGHWHRPQSFDGGRLVMPGTPEPTDFSEVGAGQIHEVEIAGRGAAPRVTPTGVAELTWREWNLPVTADLQAQFAQRLSSLGNPARSVVRLTLAGEAAPELVTRTIAWLQEQLASCEVAQIVDDTSPALGESEIAELQREHPLLADVLGELRSLGDSAATEAVRALAERLGLPAEALNPRIATLAQRLLLREWREVCERC
jgi:DNA repair exonuclease SbcCD nuclease subunit